MKILINNVLNITTTHNLEEIGELIKDNTIEISKDNLIFWKNVWGVEVLNSEDKE